MKKITCIYKNMNKFLQFLEEKDFPREGEYFIKIFTSILTREESVNLAREIKHYLPNSQIIGGSSWDLIHEGKIEKNATMVLVHRYDHLKPVVNKYTWKEEDAYQLAKEVYTSHMNHLNNTVHIFFSDNYFDINAFVENINMYKPAINLVGGILTPQSEKEENGFVFTDQGVIDKGAITFQLVGEPLNDTVCYNIPNDPISEVFKITKIENSYIDEIEGIPSKQWFQQYFRMNYENVFNPIQESKGYNFYDTYLIHFLMVLENHDGAGRFIRYDTKEDKLSLYYSTLPVNTKFRIGFFNPMKSRQNLYEMFNEMKNRDIESLFCYACLFRKQYFMKMIETELSPIKDTNVSGVFMNGEICHINDKSELLNGSFLLTEIAENPNKYNIDIDAFMETAKVKLDPSVVDFVMNEKRNELQKQANFFGELEGSEKEVSSKFPNIIQYNKDNSEEDFNRMLLIYIENADMIMGTEGYVKYIKTVLDSIEEIKDHVSENFHGKMYIYELSYCIYVITVKRDTEASHCKAIMRDLVEHYRVIQPENTNIPVVLKFVMVIGQDNMLQKAITGLQETKTLDLPYLISETEEDTSDVEGKKESNILSVLRNAIVKRKIIPYYQGIHNNKTGKITKYEALMRIQDDEGKIYPPIAFLDIAKKYHLYIHLSKIMIEKVLEEMKDRTEEVSINISAYDIHSKEFCKWFWKKVEKFPDTSRLVIEIVESEQLKDWEKVKEFIKQARQRGIQIAVDDFGDGYSNLMQIIRLRPKYIKIDGSIVSGICETEDNKIALESINNLSKSIKAQVIAEFVENAEIQKVISDQNIEFSQGYHFAKPKPIDEI